MDRDLLPKIVDTASTPASCRRAHVGPGIRYPSASIFHEDGSPKPEAQVQ